MFVSGEDFFIGAIVSISITIMDGKDKNEQEK